MIDEIKKLFNETCPKGVEYASIRYVNEQTEVLTVEKGIPRPSLRDTDRGVMVVVAGKNSYGYAATSSLNREGIKQAFEHALRWCKLTEKNSVDGVSLFPRHNNKANYKTRVEKPWENISASAKFELLVNECKKLQIDPRIVHTMTSLWSTKSQNFFMTTDGAEITQEFSFLVPQLSVTANEKTATQTRTQSGHNKTRQGGLEVLDYFGFFANGPQMAREAIELLEAPSCPTDTRSLLLSPDQLYIQIHESVGHPLEMDRILGDERNYAGTSFVQTSDFGKLQYGSKLMNITYDPLVENELNSFLYDDDGLKAQKVYLVENGVLKASLGGFTSQQRSGVPVLQIPVHVRGTDPPLIASPM